MKKLNSLRFKLLAVVAFGALSACSHLSGDSGKTASLPSNLTNGDAASLSTSVAVKTLSPPPLSSALVVQSQSWKPLFVAASAGEEPRNVKVVQLQQSQQPVQMGTSFPASGRLASPLSPVSSAVIASVATAASSTVTAPIFAPLKMDKSLDSLKYAIYFEYASANLNPTGKAALEYLQGDAKMADAIQVVGRADPSGDATKNVRLAQARANSVRSELAKYGVNVKNIKVNSYVALAKADDRVAYKQNLPADLSAASRRADVDMLIKPNIVSKLTVHSNFVSVPG